MYCVLCTVYCVLCTVYCVLCTVYCVLCTVYCVLCTVYCVLCTVYCVLCTVYCVLCTVYCVLCTVYCVLCTVYCVLCTVYCVLCTVYCVLCTVYCVLCTVYCVLCTVYCVLCTVYCVLCTVYCVLCTVYCVLCTVYCVLCTVYCVLCTVYCVLCTVYCVLCTVYCVLCTVYCVLCTVYCVLCTVYCVPYDPFVEWEGVSGFAGWPSFLPSSIMSHATTQPPNPKKTPQSAIFCYFLLFWGRQPHHIFFSFFKPPQHTAPVPPLSTPYPFTMSSLVATMLCLSVLCHYVHTAKPSDICTTPSPEPSEETSPFYTLKEMSPPEGFGVKVTGIDLNTFDLSTPGFVEVLKEDIKKHRLLLFKEQGQVSGDRQVEISELLGTVVSRFNRHWKSPHPGVFRISNDPEEGLAKRDVPAWHVDGCFMRAPFQYLTMHVHAVCADSETWLVPLREVVESLPPLVRGRWERVWGVRGQDVHPLVYRHPMTDEVTMMFHMGVGHTDRWGVREDGAFVEWVAAQEMADEVSAVIDALLPTVGMKLAWDHGDFALFDNAAITHRASPGTQQHPSRGVRILHRTTISVNSSAPTNALGETSFTLPGAGSDAPHYLHNSG